MEFLVGFFWWHGWEHMSHGSLFRKEEPLAVTQHHFQSALSKLQKQRPVSTSIVSLDLMFPESLAGLGVQQRPLLMKSAAKVCWGVT